MYPGSLQEHSGNYNYSISRVDIEAVNEVFIQHHSAEHFRPDDRDFLKLHPESIEINSALFSNFSHDAQSSLTWVIRQGNTFLFSCPCHTVQNKLCCHQAQALYNIIKRRELRIFFDSELRTAQLKKFSEPYGLQHETNIEQYFDIAYADKNIRIKPVSPSIFPVSTDQAVKIDTVITSAPGLPVSPPGTEKEQFVVFKLHKYYRHLLVGLFEAASTQNGKPKNPINQVNAAEKIWSAENSEVSKFYFGIEQFQNKNQAEMSASTIEGLKAILKNPLGLKFYHHQVEISENIVASAIVPFPLGQMVHNAELSVKKSDPFYEVSALIDLEHIKPPLDQVNIKYDYFLEINGSYHLSGNLRILKVVEFFKKHNNKLLIHHSKYEEFRQSFLSKLENDTEIRYEYLPPATAEQLRENKLDTPPERIIYLKDSDPYVELDPVMKYGDSEISVLSKKQIYPQGIKRTFSVSRNYEAEIAFTAQIIRQHSYFREQSEDALPYFYLHKKHFLNEDWFLNAFEDWRTQGIKILGFNKLKENKLNPNPARISVRILSGIDWFNAEIDVRFGKKKASLKKIDKAIRNKSKYVALDDGTLGILPLEWIQKFGDYFSTGDLEDDSLKIPKSNFSVISQLFEEEMIDGQVKEELQFLNEKLADFRSIEEVTVPNELKAQLREYQKHGLNWLNFLDDFNFGGCLADDMGLGKTLQVIAFILLLRHKREHNTNLLVVPTSLIFNWQAEIEKFAPDLKVHILYGASRLSEHKTFNNYELIITSYGTLLSDVRFLKNYGFNYVFLDESQNIKNPDSQRYKAACLLKSRNRIVITGTPIENNTFDLYGQLSFASPGLLGSKQYFKEIFLDPIDQFGDSKRAKELQRKIQPFILRRTKSQVLKELPEKTEMVIYCEMGMQQRKVYDAFEKEFREFICSKTNEEIPRSSIHVLKGLTRLRQICNSPLLLHDDEIHERESAKIEVLMEQVLSKTSEHKILIFSQFVSMLDLIRKELTERDIPFSYLSGNTKDRNKVVKEFQEEPDRRVFLISLKAGGTGLNLTQADYVYLVDPWWNPAVENQAIDRIYRIGQKKNVVAVRLICTDTIEEKIMQMQEEKKDLFNELINTDTTIAKSFTKDGLLKLLNTPLA
ncbi:DEAD/DEAH box helicase [Paradesertivirga mongoliensis]|uniref:DEAD/DEAH box helicase n=1 Tax=Paradesertivirga mongoliensis TaxID=2100740 RepID=A0ABW4ZQG7_9SPHI|nr:DEAD/DEAH box helicase [Pedobacter mongoliensis]